MSGIFLTKRSGWTVRMGIGGCDAASQYWNMLACSLLWKLKSCFVILGYLSNFIGDHLPKLQRVPAKFQHFWQFRQIQTCNGLPVANFRHSSVILIGSFDFADKQWPGP